MLPLLREIDVGAGERREPCAQGVNKSTVTRRAIKSTAIDLCNLSVRVREIEKKR